MLIPIQFGAYLKPWDTFKRTNYSQQSSSNVMFYQLIMASLDITPHIPSRMNLMLWLVSRDRRDGPTSARPAYMIVNFYLYEQLVHSTEISLQGLG